ncbi:hypothetical protein ACFL6N_04310 [Thermodesulfobacteriota bacterium]
MEQRDSTPPPENNQLAKEEEIHCPICGELLTSQTTALHQGSGELICLACQAEEESCGCSD